MFSIEGALPMSVRLDATARSPSLSAVLTRLRSTCRSTGFDTKSKAPALRASMAEFMLPCAVIMATGRPG